MDQKLKQILLQINFDLKYFDEFKNAKMLKAVLDKDNLKVCIYNETNLSLEVYSALEKSFIASMKFIFSSSNKPL